MTTTFAKLSPEKQNAILDAAAYVFARKGYHQANVIDICKKAGISNGALYKYFKNKKDLYIKVFSSHIDRLADIFSQYYKAMETTEPSFFDMIEELMSLTPEYIERERDYLKIYHDLGSASMDEFTSDLSQKFEDIAYRFWIKLVDRGKRKGEIRKDIDSDVAAYMMDNHITLFNFSCVSGHYAKRFKVFFKHKDEDITVEEKISQMKRSLRQLLT
jgi:TetR/AcrR family transcriptional regulator